ncbi:MAG: DUF4926 domain-containing protein [Oscillospiraceae bacterium]|nr:DUF4926 domain-containing protein [Oscillospiraceae bacterium]
MKELDIVQLTRDFEGLATGTNGVIVLQYDSTCFEVEFYDNTGETIGVYTTPASVLALCARGG